MSIRALVFLPPALLLLSGAASAQRAEMRFRGMDRNNDGVITRDEWRGSAQSFRVHDWNRDGVLSGDEVNPSAREPTRPLDRDEYPGSRDTTFRDWTEPRFRDLDHNRDGRVTRDEWHFDIESFRRADYNGDGGLTLNEFLGKDIDDDDRADRFVDLDDNRDGRIDRNEWHGGLRAFEALDRNRDGILTREEIASRSDDPTADLFASLDVNRDRRITQNEWHWSLDSFRQHDTNRDGALSRAELGQGAVGTTGRAQTPAYRAGYSRGLAEGRTAGHGDKSAGHGWDLEGQTELEQANSGYGPNMGPLNEYQDGYRAGFRAGYREGFGPR
jgi:Ca2+-binding EF-hand superfamily protein